MYVGRVCLEINFNLDNNLIWIDLKDKHLFILVFHGWAILMFQVAGFPHNYFLT